MNVTRYRGPARDYLLAVPLVDFLLILVLLLFLSSTAGGTVFSDADAESSGDYVRVLTANKVFFQGSSHSVDQLIDKLRTGKYRRLNRPVRILVGPETRVPDLRRVLGRLRAEGFRTDVEILIEDR